MPKTTAFADAVEDLLFNNDALPNVGTSPGIPGSSSAGVFYVSLHTSSPGVGGNQTTNEAAYAGYARIAVVRTSAGWVRSGSTYSPAATIVFPACTGGSETETYAGIGSDSAGAGNLFYFGPITPALSVSTGVVPELTTASTIVES